MTSYQVSFISKREIAKDTFVFEFEKPVGFEFRPGQYLEVILDKIANDLRGYERDFSIASAPSESTLMIATRMRGSGFKNFIERVPIGDKVLIKGPFGDFTLPERIRDPLVFLAGGIGIVPFRSMVKNGLEKALPQKIFLFSSNRLIKDAPFFDELIALEKEVSNFKFIPIFTRETGEIDKGEKGYINFSMIKKYVDNPNKSHYYVAGPPAFVASMWQILKLASVSEDSIRSEEFAGY